MNSDNTSAIYGHAASCWHMVITCNIGGIIASPIAGGPLAAFLLCDFCQFFLFMSFILSIASLQLRIEKRCV